MGYALAKEQQRYVERLLRSGRFNNQGEVVREALRRMGTVGPGLFDSAAAHSGPAGGYLRN